MMEIVPVSASPFPLTVCKICGLSAHGVHFGVTACRACAAFFRRFVVLGLEYQCLQDKTRCSMDKLRRSSCRHCRFQKCVRMGMTSDNVQLNRDVYSAEIRCRKLKAQQIKNDENDALISVNEPSTSLYSVVKIENQLFTRAVLNEVNFDNIEKEMHRMFMEDSPSCDQGYFASLSPLQKCAEGLRQIRGAQKTGDIEFKNTLSLETLVPHWRQQAKNMAILSMHSMAFRRIPLTEKSRIFKSLWQNIYRFERIQMSTEIFGDDCVSEKKLAISCENAIRLDSLFFDIEGVSKDKLKITLQDYKIFAERCVEEVAKPLSRMKLSIEEVAWLIVNFVFHNEERILGDTLEVCDEFRDQIANDLHEYYRENNIINYAPRISKMMSIIVSMKRIHYDDLGGTFTAHSKSNSKLAE